MKKIEKKKLYNRVVFVHVTRFKIGFTKSRDTALKALERKFLFSGRHAKGAGISGYNAQVFIKMLKTAPKDKSAPKILKTDSAIYTIDYTFNSSTPDM